MRKPPYAGVFAAALLGLTSVFVTPQVKAGCSAVEYVFNPPCEAMQLVFLDAGHGGSAVGNTYKSNNVIVFTESEVNLKVAKKVDLALSFNGIPVAMSRCSDVFVPNSSRVAEANRLLATIYLSVHHNGGGPSEDRSEALYAIQELQGSLWEDNYFGHRFGDVAFELGCDIAKRTSAGLGIAYNGCVFARGGLAENHPRCEGRIIDDPPFSEYYIRKAKMPAVIVEGWFIDFEASAQSYISDPEGITDLEADAYGEGLNDFFSFFCSVPILPGTFVASDGPAQVVLEWQVNPEPGDSWSIYRSDNCFGPFEQIAYVEEYESPYYLGSQGNIDLYEYVDNTMTESQVYFYWIYEPRGGLHYYASATATNLAPANPPEVPENVDVTLSFVDTTTTISWTPTSGATGYRVYRSTGGVLPDCNPETITHTADISVPSWTDPSPIRGVENYYRVQAYDALSRYSDVSPSVQIHVDGECLPLEIQNLVVSPHSEYCGAELTWTTLSAVQCTVSWGLASNPFADTLVTSQVINHSTVLCGEPGLNQFRIWAKSPDPCLEQSLIEGEWNNAVCVTGTCSYQISNLVITANATECSLDVSWSTASEIPCSISWGEPGSIEHSDSTLSNTTHSFSIPIVGTSSVEVEVSGRIPCCAQTEIESSIFNHPGCVCMSINDLAVSNDPFCDATATWTTSSSTQCSVRWGPLGNLGQPILLSPGTSHSFGPMSGEAKVTYQIEISAGDCVDDAIWSSTTCVGQGGGGFSQPVFGIRQVSPNPTRTLATISFGLEESAQVKIRVYDVTGRHIKEVINQTLSQGWYEEPWDLTSDQGVRVASGVYYVLLQSGDRTSRHKIILN